jgi:hypothetical protein
MAYYPNNPNGQATMANSAPVVIASDQSPVSINVSTDVFEQLIVGSRYNQVEVNFSQIDPDLIPSITVTKTNGGDATNSSGQSVFSSGANTNGGVSAVSNTLVYYNPHSETFAAFSAVFTTGVANSYQRIGLYDANNGFFIGYNNTTFGVTLRKGGVDTFIGQGSFNVDNLTGAANSNFKRNGVPEAIDFTKDNLYRIRFGWLGAAPIFFETYSPDGDWVIFHVIRHPNSSTSASINNPDLPVTLDIQKTGAGATNLVMSSGCWGAGTTSDLKKLSDTVTDSSLAKTVRSVIAAKDGGGNYVNIGATVSGNLETAISEVGAGVTFPITDNGGSITVDGTIAATQSGTWNINNISGTISLPTGAATETTLSTLNSKVPSNLTVSSTRLLVDGSGVTQPISGTVAATQSGVWNVGLSAGTNYIGRARLTDGTTDAEVIPLTNYNAQAVAIVDGSGNQLTSFPVTNTGTFAVQAAQSGTWNINNISGTITLPTGAATEATLSTLNGKIPSNLTVTSTRLLVDGSGVTQPVSGSVSVSNFPATQPVSGTVTANAGTGTFTVGGTVAATQSGTWNVGLNAGANAIGSITNTSFAATQATAANLNATVVGTGTFAVQAAQSGTWNIGTLTSITNPVTVSGTVTASNTAGDVAHDSPDSGNPVKIGFKADVVTALTGAVANNDRVDGVADRYGRQLVAQIDASMQVWRAVEYVTAQTGTNIWVPTTGNRFVVTQINITTGGTTAGLVTIWGAQTATTTYTPGTDQAFFRGVLTPTANATPGALIQPPHPMFSDTTNDCLKITTSAAMTVYIQVYGYEITP